MSRSTMWVIVATVGGLVVLPLLSCGGIWLLAVMKAATRPVARPQTIPQPIVTPVLFDVRGLKVGDGRNFLGPDFDTFDVHGHEVFMLRHFDDNKKLIGLTLTFDSDAFEPLVETYTEKFGCPPHETNSSGVQTRIGARYTNVFVAWQTDAGRFVIKKYGESITKGFAVLESPEYLRTIRTKRAKEKQELQRRL